MAIREIRQEGPYCYTYSPFHAPNATVEPGERVNGEFDLQPLEPRVLLSGTVDIITVHPSLDEVSVIANRGDGQFGAVSVARTSVATTSAKSAGSACAWPLVAVGA